MSDYGLLSRKLTLDVEYEDTPYTLEHAKVPVFAVGRNQLYQLFGLQGYECPRVDNIYCSLEYSDLEHASYALVCLGGEWSNSYVTLRRMVCLCDVYDSFEQASMHTGLALELDAEKALINPHCYPIYQYEIWQICDDSELYGEWNVEVMAHVIQRSVYGVGVCDRKHKPNSNLFSEDYLSSLKTANQVERCSACGETLHKPYQFYVGGHGLVCHRCWSWYRFGINVWDEQVLADRLMRAALYDGFEDDPNWEDDGRPNDWWDE